MTGQEAAPAGHHEPGLLVDIGGAAWVLQWVLQMASAYPMYALLFFANRATQASNNAAVTASTNADDDGRANALVRRYSALGLTEPLT